MQLTMCKHCHKLFYSRMRAKVCDECKSKDEEVFDRIEEYLIKYPNSNALQIAEGLQIDVFEVLSYMSEGRLTVVKGKWSRE